MTHLIYRRRRRLAGQTWQDFFNLTTEQCEVCGLPLFKDEIECKRCDECAGKPLPEPKQGSLLP